MHPVYTHVPQRSFDAYASSNPVTLDEVLCALIVDPLEAEDAAKDRGVQGTPHSLCDFADQGMVPLRIALETIAQWVSSHAYSPQAITDIARYDERLGVWCGCQVARNPLQYESVYISPRTHALIEVTEAWVRGNANLNDILQKRRLVWMDKSNDLARVALFVSCYPELSRYGGGLSESVIVAATAWANLTQFVSGTEEWEQARLDHLRFLRGVIARACLSYPVVPT